MIEDLYFISGLYPNLGMSSFAQLSRYLHLHMDDLQFGYKQFLKKKTLLPIPNLRI